MEPKVKEYRKLKSGDAGYKQVQHARSQGMWVCDSYDHNEPTGCSNPECFKNPEGKKRWDKKGD